MRQPSCGTRERMRLTSIHPSIRNLSNYQPKPLPSVLLLLAVFSDSCLLHLYRFKAPACAHPYQNSPSPSRLWLFWWAMDSRAKPMLSFMTTLLMWGSLPREKLCLFSSVGYKKSPKWASFKRLFARVPAWVTLALAAHHRSVKFTYFYWRESHTGCLEIVMSTGIAQHFPYFYCH